MKYMKKLYSLLIALMLMSAAHADNWHLIGTTPFGAGGFWENQQKVRMERSFRDNVFQYERKVSEGRSLLVFSSKCSITGLQQEYAPGEQIALQVELSRDGKPAAAPEVVYARVTVLPVDPGWTEASWLKSAIDPFTDMEGQLTDENGNFLVQADGTPVMLTGILPSKGNRMAIVYSCNGMDVVHLYGREEDEAPVTITEAAPAPETADTATDETDAPRSFPLKQVLLGLLALLAMADLIFMFTKK